MHLCLANEQAGWKESGVYLRILKTYYDSLSELTITLAPGFSLCDGDVLYTLSDAFEYVCFGEEVTVEIRNADGELMQSVICYKNSTVSLPDVSGENAVLLGWLIGGQLYAPSAKYSVGETDSSVTAVLADFSMKYGASVCVTGNPGIRFTYQFGEEDWLKYGEYIVESGIMLLPTDTLDGKEFVMENFTDGETVVVGRGGAQKQALNPQTGKYEYILRLIRIFESNYARDFSARGYLLVRYADGTTGYVYTDYSETANSRSVMQVSRLCRESDNGEYASMDEAARKIIDDYIAIGESNLPKDYVIEVSELSVEAIYDAYSTALALTGEELAGYADIEIHLPEGVLELNETLKFPQETRVNGRLIRFVGNGTEISGGRTVSGEWTSCGEDGVYFLDVGTGFGGVRQLYVNGVPATLARTGNVTGTWNTTDKTLRIPVSSLEGLTVGGKMEASTLERWAQSYGVISSVATDGDSYVFTFTAESEYVYFGVERGYADENPVTFLQNSLSFLDEENEFYYDASAGRLYYKPIAGADINALKFTLPVLETLLTTEGMTKVSFESISFSYSGFTQPSVYGYLEQQANVYSSPEEGHGWTLLPEMIAVLSDQVSFRGCTVRGAGATAIGVRRGAGNVTLEENVILFTAGTPIFVGDNVDSNDGLPVNVSIVGNFVDSYGTCYGGAAGITVTYADTVLVSRNTVENGYYSGISAGWGWTGNTEALHGNYTVTYNRIVNPMRGELYDGGGIYLLGNFVAQTENVVAYNYVEITGSCLAAIYLDEGTSDYTVRNNALKVNESLTRKGCIFLHNLVNRESGLGMKNISVSDNYSNLTTCDCKYVRAPSGVLLEITYNSKYNVSYEKATGSDAEHINESIYNRSGATCA